MRVGRRLSGSIRVEVQFPQGGRVGVRRGWGGSVPVRCAVGPRRLSGAHGNIRWQSLSGAVLRSARNAGLRSHPRAKAATSFCPKRFDCGRPTRSSAPLQASPWHPTFSSFTAAFPQHCRFTLQRIQNGFWQQSACEIWVLMRVSDFFFLFLLSLLRIST